MESTGEFAKQVALDIELTDRIAGKGDVKGLQQRINEERFKRDGIVEEQRIVEPLWKVADVDTGLLLRRRETLDDRIQELQEYLQRKHKVKLAAARVDRP